MAEQTMPSATSVAGAAAGKGKQPRKALDLRYQPGFGTIAIFCLLLLYAPILVLSVFSFNGGPFVTR